jgi:hypothetical protein
MHKTGPLAATIWLTTLIYSICSAQVGDRVGDAAPAWAAACSDLATLKSIEFKSPSKDVTNDDMVVRLRWKNKTDTKLPLSAWYVNRPDCWSADTRCSGVGAYRVQTDHVVLLLPMNGRPGNERLSIVLLNFTDRKVLDVKDDIGEIAYHFAASVGVDSISVYMNKELPDTKERGALSVPGWLDISIRQGKIQTRWRN